ncbi:MAG: hypothetical protein QXM24_05195 [Saccharolobus sp.]
MQTGKIINHSGLKTDYPHISYIDNNGNKEKVRKKVVRIPNEKTRRN